MKKESQTSISQGSREKPAFRLIVHIGAEKTGTSSIQQTLRHAYDKLRTSGTLYLGMMLELAPVKKYDWQKAGAIEAFHKMGSAKAGRELLDVLKSTIASASEEGLRQAIWSNESFFGRGSVVMPALQELAAENVDLRLIVYVRRHDAWSRSSYVQWGLKHKTYAGPLLPYDKFRNMRPAQFSRHIKPWREAFGPNLVIRNLDEVGDAVEDFFAVAGLSLNGIEKLRRNETPSGEELTLRALFNEQIPGKALPEVFDRTLQVRNMRFDVSPNEWLSELLPSAEELQAEASNSAGDREVLNQWLAASGARPIDTSRVSLKDVTVDPAKLLTALSQIVMRQSVRIQAMEALMEGGGQREESATTQKMKPSPAVKMQEASGNDSAPVFAISTGRSGSTLVQRLLNCHQDLVVWGEHYGMLNGLAQAYNQMSDPAQKLFPRTERENRGPAQLLPTLTNPAAAIEWANPWSLEEFRQQLRRLVEGYFASKLEPGQRWGFKEILYNSMPPLRMLHELYPGGKFVFIKRNPVEVSQSKIAAFVSESKWESLTRPEKAERIRSMLVEVRNHYRLYAAFLERYPSAGTIVNFEELVAQPRDVVSRLLTSLDLAPDRFDWALSEKVMGNVITKMKRDTAVASLVDEIASTMDW